MGGAGSEGKGSLGAHSGCQGHPEEGSERRGLPSGLLSEKTYVFARKPAKVRCRPGALKLVYTQLCPRLASCQGVQPSPLALKALKTWRVAHKLRPSQSLEWNHLEGLLKHRLLDTTPEGLSQQTWVGAQDSAFVTGAR